ncbi:MULTISPECIES: amidase family protein [Bradyrhizobium]|uniref:amidase family protein n=1 Tax=Bradyrhizobium TaxID=374 RepID=UPI00155F379F|nr:MULTISPECIES: amidase family protein [Bradyrhizobium]MDD1522214.1 amidase [Bradyrhizobium sp. WBAH30]MDD1546298.1 amidase [Bradyrhizobium sp. WBAH41]MDD1559721.1 amidase [Bradyrhizobium sp. WBAH23]MDD1567593.1 amidase [Bradyrhizobium sp. WBAH33]MDD1593131.1 amidase [Bradyrhizobium sp. WBAH42]
MAKKTATKKKSASRQVSRASSKTSTARKGAIAKTAKTTVKKAAPRKPAAVRRPKGPIWQWSAVETAAAVRAGAISAVETVEAHLDRMRAVNPRLNAVVVDLGEEALKAAHAADKQRAKGGDLGLLHGVPITIKENVDYQGRPNFNGVPANKDLIAPSDAPVVRNLKKSGAIVIGLTNTPEFSFRGFTDNPLHGLTLNPWDPDITCGGSSGGAGSAVAAGIGTIAHGNDIGGSLRWPAHCNGVATIKPTQGRIPAFNGSATSERPMLAHLMSAQGPLARHVADVRLALEVMSRRDPRDPWWVPAPLVGERPKGPIKVALAKIPEDMDVDPSVAAALRQAADHLERSGYRVSEVEVPDINGVWQTWCDIITNETVMMQEAAMLKVTSEDFHKSWGGMKAKANVLDLKAWMQATAARNGHIRAWQLFFEDYPIVLAPTTVKPTPGPREDTVSAERVREIFWGEIRFISAINVLGLPGAVVPVALHDGKPIGVQLIAGRYREDLALDAAAAIEKRVGALTHRLWEQMG